MNYFFALSLAGIASRIQRDLLQPLSRADTAQQVRWSLPENLHITLAYLGALNADRLKQAVICAEAIHADSFDLPIGSLSHFPDAKSRILALDVAREQALLSLQQALGRQLESHNIAYDDRPYRPHITLGRIKHREAIDGRQLPEYRASLWVKEFVLYASGSDSAYTVVKRFPLVR